MTSQAVRIAFLMFLWIPPDEQDKDVTGS